MGSDAEVSTPTFIPLTIRQVMTQVHAAPTPAKLVYRLLVAVCSPVEAADFTTGPWATFYFTCPGRGANPAPESGPGVKLKSETNRNSWTCACLRWAEAFWKIAVSPTPAEPGWRPPDWPVGHSPDPSTLAVSAFRSFFSIRMSHFSRRNTDGDTSPR